MFPINRLAERYIVGNLMPIAPTPPAVLPVTGSDESPTLAWALLLFSIGALTKDVKAIDFSMRMEQLT